MPKDLHEIKPIVRNQPYLPPIPIGHLSTKRILDKKIAKKTECILNNLLKDVKIFGKRRNYR